jgi:hypothetical protein
MSTRLFNLTWSAVTLFYESILVEHGFHNQTYLMVMAMLVAAHRPANLITGRLAQRRPKSSSHFAVL